jgi:nucleoid-associated protein YgaU
MLNNKRYGIIVLYCCCFNFVFAYADNSDEKLYQQFIENSKWYEEYLLSQQDLSILYIITDKLDLTDAGDRTQILKNNGTMIRNFHNRAFQKFKTSVEEARQRLNKLIFYKDYLKAEPLPLLQEQLEKIEQYSREGSFPYTMKDISCIDVIMGMPITFDTEEAQKAAAGAQRWADRAQAAADGARRAENVANIPESADNTPADIAEQAMVQAHCAARDAEIAAQSLPPEVDNAKEREEQARQAAYRAINASVASARLAAERAQEAEEKAEAAKREADALLFQLRFISIPEESLRDKARLDTAVKNVSDSTDKATASAQEAIAIAETTHTEHTARLTAQATESTVAYTEQAIAAQHEAEAYTERIKEIRKKYRYYTVVEGDWLIKIAKRFYGDDMLWPLIYETNKYTFPQINNPDYIKPGMELIIPPKP